MKNYVVSYLILLASFSIGINAMKSSDELSSEELDQEYFKAIKAGSCDKLNKAIKKTTSSKIKNSPPASPQQPVRLDAIKKPHSGSDESAGSGKITTSNSTSETDLKYLALLKERSAKYEKKLQDPHHIRILNKLKKVKDEGKIAALIAASSGYGLYELIASTDPSSISVKEVILLLNGLAALSYAARKTYNEYFTKKDLDDKWARSLAMLTIITKKLGVEATPSSSNSVEFFVEVEENSSEES